ncbi:MULTISPECIES: ParB/RepB/Spo0J family partition protein [Streptomyces]|uniref:Streptomycin biosynthesis protein n=3 Tax=Streptomyces TaxID=1883 RepID=A0A3S9PPZ4_STRLT|nr:ParB N-terminal domain-containing protein [Streptomyces luteoverticillatus]AZQ74456.1 streptomycin biosynthesis protein [Streptomyces luteoverticillatus]
MTVSGPEQRHTVVLPLTSLLPAASPRLAGEDPRHVQAIARLDSPLPPIVVHRATLRVVDGMHRLRAARLRGDERIAVRFFEGSEEDAFVHAVRANTRPGGLPLTRADRSAAAERIIRSHPHWSDRLIASAAGLAASTVATLRRRTGHPAAPTTTRTGRDGRVRPLNAADGRRRAGALIAARPEASLREIAHDAGIAVGTARDVRLRLALGQDPVPKKLRDAERRDTGSVPSVVSSVVSSAVGDAASAVVAPVVVPSSAGDGSSSLSRLRTDPSLRLTEGGRILLRLLNAHAMGGDRWRRLLDAVPAHRRQTVAQAARHCAASWMRFATELERRGG